jgi:transposase
VDQVCDGCLVGKQRRTPFLTQARHCVSSILNLVHGDLCGPVTPVTPDEKRFFLLLVDDMSRYMWLHLIASKDQAPAEIINFKVTVEVETEKKLKVLQTDRGGEFTSVEFRQYCTERGVHHQFTTLYCPQQNGVVERRNQSVVAMALHGYFWGRLCRRLSTSSTGHQHAPSTAGLHLRLGTVRLLRSTTSACLVASRMSRTHGQT